MNLRDVLSALRAHWWMPLLGIVLGAGAALGLVLLQTPLYTSSTQLFVSTTASTSSADAYQGGQFSEQRAASYARLAAGEELAGRVVDRLELEMTPGEVSSAVTATALPGTVLIDVDVTDESAQRAQQIAEALGTEFPALVQELEAPSDDGAPLVRVTVTDEPEAPQVPSSPNPVQNVVLGVLVGALLGALAAVARRRLDRSVKDPEEAAALAGAPVIGTVLRDDTLERQHVVGRTSSARAAEDFRLLRTNLQFLNVDEPPKVIMVTSALPSEGKTTAVVNLALALAESGRRVTVLEADLRRPKVTRYLGLVGGVGLTNVLAGTADLDDVVQRHGDGALSVVGSGPTPPNPGELLASSHMSALLDKLRGASDFVLIDAPPLLPVADAVGLSVLTDGVLLSVRYGSTRTDQLEQAAASLQRVGARVLGVILNIVPPRAEFAPAYGYGYGYEARGDGKHSL
ncbi:polysaccharide biosynthesis tyrosine autokinase [Geodermatophilus normandii]|uniref:Polysaccharide biosynthesis tyrosine autokinase n=1 Tax=Geodermatophilus normandii TaxID=1137989 RepID=A0A6P0GFC3_9ACTN|nr:polysaccharide biosynthesis tyrosine autokinase [Geodermatophilus normandii]NEM05942.1 polysaccharide biosynthesis tyrosine autokinase [Geodermatophilus normandii]